MWSCRDVERAYIAHLIKNLSKEMEKVHFRPKLGHLFSSELEMNDSCFSLRMNAMSNFCASDEVHANVNYNM